MKTAALPVTWLCLQFQGHYSALLTLGS